VEYLDDLYDVFRKNDTKIVFFGRFMPGARGFIGLPAGSTHMNFWIFLWYTFAGTLVWTTFLVVLGYYLGQKREVIVGYLKQFDHLMLPIIAGGLVLFIAWMIWKREKKTN
jgi:membrane protein DedA with SNARE-associated domain